MPQSDDERLADLATRPERKPPGTSSREEEDPRTDPPREDPRPARPPSAGRPAHPRGNGHPRIWWVLGIGVTTLIAGVALPDGLLIAAGLVLSGIAVQLLDPDRRRTGGPHRRRTPR